MGIVVTFPAARPATREGIAPQAGSATVIILPVIRIDRGPDCTNGLDPGTGNNPGRRRRRRALR